MNSFVGLSMNTAIIGRPGEARGSQALHLPTLHGIIICVRFSPLIYPPALLIICGTIHINAWNMEAMAVSMYIAIIMNIQEKHGRAVKHCTFLTLNGIIIWEKHARHVKRYTFLTLHGIIIWARCLSSLSSSIHVNARNVEAMYTAITMVV
uniref:Uncharacterized protein n=1 Tax=Oryza nivara TaxID=4536 RepID=A0A0E0IZQ9_ORYNI